VLEKSIKQLNRVSISVSLGLGLVLGLRLVLGLMPSSDIVFEKYCPLIFMCSTLSNLSEVIEVSHQNYGTGWLFRGYGNNL